MYSNILRLAIRYLYRSLPNQLGSYLNWKLLAKDQQTPKLLRSPLRVGRHMFVVYNMFAKKFQNTPFGVNGSKINYPTIFC